MLVCMQKANCSSLVRFFLPSLPPCIDTGHQGKGKTIKSLLHSVDTSVATQKAKVLRRIDSLTSREEGEMLRSPSGGSSAMATPAAAKVDPKAEKTSIFRKFSKDAVSTKKDRDTATPVAASPQRISLMNIPVRNPPPKIVRKHKQKRKLVGAIRVLDVRLFLWPL